MRIADLDRDMRDVIPTGSSRESEFLFACMTERTLAQAGAGPGRWILDVASGLGQDARALAARGARAVAAEPSRRMSALARAYGDGGSGADPLHARAWADALPFAAASFDAVICKGSLDHFDRPERALAEMARVTRPRGRVVLAVANFESAGLRGARARDRVREALAGREPPRGRRLYDVPHDHVTRYEVALLREQVGAVLELELVEGISLGWGLPGWGPLLAALPERAAGLALSALDACSRRLPAWADVVLLVGRPRRSATTSA